MDLRETDIAPGHPPVNRESFEDTYAAIRDKEGRVYTDKQVANLPVIDPAHQYSAEWKMRARSVQRLIDHLKSIGRPLNILEVGCGNGWMTAKLAQIPDSKVTGIDTNTLEIDQARRVFNNANLKFINKPFNSKAFGKNEKFDVIIFAASLSYFSSIKTVINNAFALLNAHGIIHIIDTPFYNENTVETAIQRCQAYYQDMGYGHMAGHYHHHLLNKILGFNHKIMFDPFTFWNKLRKQGAFYWITLKP